jgi:hypothetical protein
MKKLKITFGLILSLVLFLGCASMQIDSDPKRAYLVALEQYIVIGDMYLEHKDLFKPEDALEIKSMLLRADFALDAWKIALSINESGSNGEYDALLLLQELAVILPKALEEIE